MKLFCSKYPIAKFSFYENGTIDKIKLPNIMNNYNAYTIIELINNTIPKLPINRSDGMVNFIYIDNIDYINKKTLIEKQSPREIKKQKGSVFKKNIICCNIYFYNSYYYYIINIRFKIQLV